MIDVEKEYARLEAVSDRVADGLDAYQLSKESNLMFSLITHLMEERKRLREILDIILSSLQPHIKEPHRVEYSAYHVDAMIGFITAALQQSGGV
jgi:hypothetical protein